jgi:branched-chain amino acid transport system substrate-binding protein
MGSYLQRYGRYPSYGPQNAYLCLRLLAGMIWRAGTLEPEVFIPCLEGIRYEAPMGRIALRGEDHQGVADAV